jgi:hypothetical protein
MDERELRERANTLHEYLVGVDDREKAAEKRHAELIRVTEHGLATINKTVEKYMRELIDAVRTQSR